MQLQLTRSTCVRHRQNILVARICDTQLFRLNVVNYQDVIELVSNNMLVLGLVVCLRWFYSSTSYASFHVKLYIICHPRPVVIPSANIKSELDPRMVGY